MNVDAATAVEPLTTLVVVTENHGAVTRLVVAEKPTEPVEPLKPVEALQMCHTAQQYCLLGLPVKAHHR